VLEISVSTAVPYPAALPLLALSFLFPPPLSICLLITLEMCAFARLIRHDSCRVSRGSEYGSIQYYSQLWRPLSTAAVQDSMYLSSVDRQQANRKPPFLHPCPLPLLPPTSSSKARIIQTSYVQPPYQHATGARMDRLLEIFAFEPVVGRVAWNI